MAIRVERQTGVGGFLELAGEYLAGREAEHNLIFALTATLASNPEVYPIPPLFAVALEGSRVVGAAMRTPPHNLVLAEVAEPGLAPPVVAALVGDLRNEALPGVSGPAALAAAFAMRWAGAAGVSTRREMAERIYTCTKVIPPRPTDGRPRTAEAGDRDLLSEWLRAFTVEAGLRSFEDPAVLADRWLRRVTGRTMWLWDVDGRVTSLSGVSGPTPHGLRIGPVYTPPGERGRGYASNLVAAATQAQLDAGKAFVFLFTDLANPTSNRVYQAIGYEAVSDVDVWTFEPTD